MSHVQTMLRRLLPIALASTAALPTATRAAPAFEMKEVTFFVTEEALEERLAHSATELGNHVQAIADTCSRTFAGAKAPGALDVVVVVQPGQRARVWLANPAGPASKADLKALRAALEKLTPPNVRGGPVAFAIRASILGGTPPPLSGPPFPKEWKPTIEKRGVKSTVVPDEVLAELWSSRW